jgi:hypothetical protein
MQIVGAAADRYCQSWLTKSALQRFKSGSLLYHVIGFQLHATIGCSMEEDPKFLNVTNGKHE